MKISKDIEDKFYEGIATKRTRFGINASVLIVRGPYQGQRGSILSLVTIDPQPRYLVELENGMDSQIDEADLSQI